MDGYDAAVDLFEIDDQFPDGQGSSPLTQTASTQTEPCNLSALPSSVVHTLGTVVPKAVNNQAIQAGPSLLPRPYQCYETRKRSELRSEIIEKVHDLLGVYVHGDSMALSDLVDDLVSSKKWASTFRSAAKKQDKPDGKFLSSLLKDYQECKRFLNPPLCHFLISDGTFYFSLAANKKQCMP